MDGGKASKTLGDIADFQDLRHLALSPYVQGWHILAVAAFPVKPEETLRQGKEENRQNNREDHGLDGSQGGDKDHLQESDEIASDHTPEDLSPPPDKDHQENLDHEAEGEIGNSGEGPKIMGVKPSDDADHPGGENESQDLHLIDVDPDPVSDFLTVIDGGHDQAIARFDDFVYHPEVKEHDEHGDKSSDEEIDLDHARAHQGLNPGQAHVSFKNIRVDEGDFHEDQGQKQG